MKKRPDGNNDSEAMSDNSPGGAPTWRWPNPLENFGQQLGRGLRSAGGVLRDLAGTSDGSIAEADAKKREKINRLVMPSETIDDDVSTASVFVVAILLMVLVTVAMFFMMTSGLPVFSLK